MNNCIGMRDFEADAQVGLELESGDRLLVCTDGLYGLMSRDRITELLGAAGSSLADTAQGLLNEAVVNGGDDNISIVLIDASTGS